MEEILCDVVLFVGTTCMSGFLLHEYFTTTKRSKWLVVATALITTAAVLSGIVVAWHIASL